MTSRNQHCASGVTPADPFFATLVEEYNAEGGHAGAPGGGDAHPRMLTTIVGNVRITTFPVHAGAPFFGISQS